jgi:CHASE2 domain-containing sensor protein
MMAGLRESGVTRQWDLLALDRLLSMRPAETIDDRIIIVTIDENDLRQLTDRQNSSISDRNLATAIDSIAAAKPSVIGIDIIRDGEIDSQLIAAFEKYPNTIGLAKILPPDLLSPPQGVTTDRVGFGDYQLDADGAVRHGMLAIFDRDRSQPAQPKYSFAFQLARLYLQQHDRQIQITPQYLQLGSHSIESISNSDSADRYRYFDIILNYRQVYPGFLSVKLSDVLLKRTSLNFQNKIIIIGYTATTKQDFVNTHIASTRSIEGKADGSIYGVEYHGQIVSQLIATTLDDRQFIQPLPVWGDYLWMVVGIASIGLVLKAIEFKTNTWKLFAIGCCYFIINLASIYLLFIAGWWLSIGLTFVTVMIIYLPILSLFYQRECSLLEIAAKRRQSISETFNTIHNGPLQELSLILQDVKSDRLLLPELSSRLEQLNHQIRQIGDSLQLDAERESQEVLILGDGSSLDLNLPLNELFHLIADRTIDRDRYPHFVNLKIKTIDFQEVPNEQNLSIDLKRQLCQFLEEAIGNVGKYAEGMTKLQLLGKVDRDLYRLSIEDNGRGQIFHRAGAGTKQAQRLAVSLQGKFNRSPNLAGQGVICAIEWNFKQKF